MGNKDLLNKLHRLGFPLIEVENHFDANETLTEVIKSKDPRLWEGFPVLLANANEEGLFNYASINNLLNDKNDTNIFIELILLSLSLYKYLSLKFWWANKLYKELLSNKLISKNNHILNIFSSHLKGNQNFKISDKYLNPSRIKRIFNNYFEEKKSELNNLGSKYEALSLEYALSNIFSPKQKELFLKRLKGEKLNKTELEYFSRSVKKKIVALANSELHRLAQKLLEH